MSESRRRPKSPRANRDNSDRDLPVARSKTLSDLRVVHLLTGCFFVAVAALSNIVSRPFDVMTSVVRTDCDGVVRVEEMYLLSVPTLVVVNLLIAGAHHFSLLIPFVWAFYQKEMAIGQNTLRWSEFALSSSLLLVVLGLLMGVYNVETLVALFSLMACCILMGWAVESIEARDWTRRLKLHFAAWIPMLSAFAILGHAYVSNCLEGPILFVFPLTVLLYALFGLLQLVTIFTPMSYESQEHMYVLLSLSAKCTIALGLYMVASAADSML